MTNSENRPFLTIKEVSKLIGLSVSTINRLVKKGDFPLKVKISPKRIVFMKKEIDVWIENQRNN
jgi:excisionase family DNA binding protein